MLRLAAALLVVCMFSSGAHAQQTIQVAPEAEKKPLVTPPKLVRFVEGAYPATEGELPTEAVVDSISSSARTVWLPK